MVAIHHGSSLISRNNEANRILISIDVLDDKNSIAYFGSKRNQTENKEKIVS